MSTLRRRACATSAAFLVAWSSVVSGCSGPTLSSAAKTVAREGEWGIYELDLTTTETRLVYSSPSEIQTSALRLNSAGDRLVFAQKMGGTADSDYEIVSIGTRGIGLTRLTDNKFFDLYPAWSPDGRHVIFISKRGGDLDIYALDAVNGESRRLYDSGDNDADIDWAGDGIVFTSQFAIWRMNADGTGATRITSPPGRGEWGKANLPKGDYDPRLNRDGTKIVFERLENTDIPNGGYNLFTVNLDGTEETRLTDTGYAQGIASWSWSGVKIVYVVAAANGEGQYDIHTMNSDGTGNRNITPSYFPSALLCHSPVFSTDDSKIFFIGQWWQ